jgi:hypothetical protein
VHICETEEKINQIINKLGFDCKVVNNTNMYKPMAYRPLENEIHFNAGQILGVSGRFSYLYEDTLLCIIYHELGHYLDLLNDPTLIEKYQKAKNGDKEDFKKVKYNYEMNAFILGRKLIKDKRLLTIYDDLNKKRLDSISIN